MGDIDLLELEKALSIVASDSNIPRKIFEELQEENPTRPILQKEVKERIENKHPEFLEGLDARNISNTIRRSLQGLKGAYYKSPGMYFKVTQKLVEIASEKVGKELTLEQVKKQAEKELQEQEFKLLE